MKGGKKFAYILLIVSALFLAGSLTLVSFDELTITSPGGYPIMISILCLIFAVWNAFDKKAFEDEGTRSVFDRTIVAFMIMLVLYFVLILYIHYTFATLLFVFAALFYLNRKDIRHAILISYISTFMILLVFKYIFSVIMP